MQAAVAGQSLDGDDALAFHVANGRGTRTDRLVVHEEATWLEANVRRLTALHEAAREAPWSVDDAPSEYIAGQLRAIVGLELLIDRLEAKSKLSQNRSAADIDGAIAGLEADGRPEVAGAMRVIRAR